MKLKPQHAALLFCLCLCRQAPSQKPVLSPQTLPVTVTNAHTAPAQPVPAVRVSLSYLDSGARITEARDVTNHNGQAFLQVASDVAQRGNLRIEISGAADLVIYQPADGQLPALPTTIAILLLPKGSVALAGAAQIEALQRRLSQHVNSLQAQTSKQQTEIKGLQSQLQAAQQQAAGQRQAVDEGLEEWAKANGLDLAGAKTKIQQWAQGIQSAPGASAEQKALAAFALKDYATAATDFGEAEDAEMAALNEQHKQQQEQNRAALAKLLQTTTQRANALQLASRYHDATAAFVRTRDYIATQQAAAPQGTPLYSIWLQAASSTANAEYQEGEVAPASQSLPLIVQATAELTKLAEEYDKAGDRQGAAKARNNLGNALLDESRRTTGNKSASLLDQAVETFRSALQPDTKTDSPQYWAKIQNCLGFALAEEGARAVGAQSVVLLDQAVQAYQRALEVDTQADFPRDWAVTQKNLGAALQHEGENAKGAQADALFVQSVQAYHGALQVFTQTDSPHDWANSQLGLGNALWDEGRHLGGEKSAALLDQAVQAFRSALHVFTQADLPQDWAVIQNNIGNTLSDEGRRTTGDHSLALLEQAVQAYRSALEVYTQADLPQDWARAQNGLGLALTNEGERTSGTQSAELLAQAIQAFRSALQVYTQAALPRDWSITQINVGGIYHDSLFQYDRALEIFQQIFLSDPSPENTLNFIEASLTAAHFDVCIQQAIKMPAALDPGWMLLRDTFLSACSYAVGDAARAHEAEAALLREAPALRISLGTFTGTLHYLSTSPAFAHGRASWIALFTAVQNGDSAGMTAALHQLEPLMKN